MAFNGAPLDLVNSDPIPTLVGTRQTKIFTATSTKPTQGTDGKVNGGTTTLYYSPDAGRYVPAATTTDGGKTWTYLNDSSGKPVLGADAKRSLDQGALKNNTQQQIVSASTKASIPKEQQKVLATQTQNTASTVGAGSSNTTSITQDQLNAGVVGGEIRSPKDYKENLRYPLDITAENQDYIQFTMIEYQPKQLNTDIEGQLASGGTTDLFISKSQQAGNQPVSSGTVTLPIQPSITDTNAVTWNDLGMDPFRAIASGTAKGLFEGSKQGGGQNTPVQDREAGTNAFGKFVASAFAGAAGGGDGQQIFTRTTGAVLNPNLELLFNGPTIRSFSFSFSMSARSDKEAIQIKKIIRFFKQGMSVKRAKSALFLKSPHIFKIKYVYGKTGSPHPWLNSFKECALTSCTVNYTPSGSYATFVDGAMTQYDLSLTFSELEPIYDDDYKKLDENKDTMIGY